MPFDIDMICRRIEEIGIGKMELSQGTAREVAFHMTDWLDDLSTFYDFCAAPKRLSDKKVNTMLLAFLCHVPNHVAAAAKLYADMPVTDIFDVGATTAEGKP